MLLARAGAAVSVGPAGRHLAGGAGAARDGSGTPSARSSLHPATYEDGLSASAARRAATARCWCSSSAPISAISIRAGARAADPHPRGRFATDDALLLGSDLVKPERDLLLAYDDPLQVTAAFNRNLLRRINDELGGTFDLDAFAHRAVWNAPQARRDALVSRSRSGCALRLPISRFVRSRRVDLDGELLQVRAAGDSRRWARRRLHRRVCSGSTRRRRFALTRFSV